MLNPKAVYTEFLTVPVVVLLACVFLSISFAAFFCFASKMRFQYPGTECMEDPAVTDGMYGKYTTPDALVGYWNGASYTSKIFCPISYFYLVGLTERDWDSQFRHGVILEDQSEFFTPVTKDAKLEVHVWDNDDRLGYRVKCWVFTTSKEGSYDPFIGAYSFDWHQSYLEESADGPQVLTFDLSAMDPTYEYFYLVCDLPPYVPERNLPSQVVGYTLTLED